MVNIEFKKVLEEAFPVIEKFAPLVASAIGGNAVGAAVQSLLLLADAFETKKPISPENIRDSILQHPNPEPVLSKLNETLPGLLQGHFPKEIDLDADIKF